MIFRTVVRSSPRKAQTPAPAEKQNTSNYEYHDIALYVRPLIIRTVLYGIPQQGSTG